MSLSTSCSTVWWVVFGIGRASEPTMGPHQVTPMLSALTQPHKEPCLSDANLPRSWCHTGRGFQGEQGQSLLSSTGTMQPDWQQRGQNGASMSSGCLSGGRKRREDSGTGACIGSTEKIIGRQQNAFCLDVARLKAKQKKKCFQELPGLTSQQATHHTLPF